MNCNELNKEHLSFMLVQLSNRPTKPDDFQTYNLHSSTIYNLHCTLQQVDTHAPLSDQFVQHEVNALCRFLLANLMIRNLTLQSRLIL